MTREVSLAWLLHPLSVEKFLTEIWATREYVIKRNRPDYFTGQIDAATIEQYLEYGRPERSAVRLIKNADKREPDAYRFADGGVDSVRIRNEFAAGYTLVLNGLERYLPAMAVLSRAIEVELGFETQVNAYITPPNSQGFLPHYDDHDVLILQIQGSKTWHVYDSLPLIPTHELRLRDLFASDGLPAPSDLILEAGDVLYLPRGRVHAAKATAEPSIHLTLGIHPPSVLALISKAVEALGYRDDRILASLPPRYAKDASMRAKLSELVREVADSIDESSIGDGIAALEDGIVRRGRCHVAGQLVANSFEAARIDEHTRVIKSQPLYSRVLAINDGVALQFGQSIVEASSDHRAAMLFLARAGESFRVGELPDLPAPQQIELARKLVIDGFLIRMPQN
jgi:bifunctional lysine-specific demethylase and histidyl-hydroxylase NO66